MRATGHAKATATEARRRQERRWLTSEGERLLYEMFLGTPRREAGEAMEKVAAALSAIAEASAGRRRRRLRHAR